MNSIKIIIKSETQSLCQSCEYAIAKKTIKPSRANIRILTCSSNSGILYSAMHPVCEAKQAQGKKACEKGKEYSGYYQGGVEYLVRPAYDNFAPEGKEPVKLVIEPFQPIYQLLTELPIH